MLAERGFRVIRFDNRDIGHSTMIDVGGDAEPDRHDARPPRPRPVPAAATWPTTRFGLMDHLGIDAAHLVGASMGGMIAQTMAIDRPERVRSLVSMMSSTGNRWLGWPHWRALGDPLRRLPEEPRGLRQAGEPDLRGVGSPGFPPEPERLEEIAGRMLGPLPQPGRDPAPDVRRDRVRRPDPGTAPASTCRSRSSTATATAWSGPRLVARPRGRFPGRGCGFSRGWATTFRAGSGLISSRRSPPPRLAPTRPTPPHCLAPPSGAEPNSRAESVY